MGLAAFASLSRKSNRMSFPFNKFTHSIFTFIGFHCQWHHWGSLCATWSDCKMHWLTGPFWQSSWKKMRTKRRMEWTQPTCLFILLFLPKKCVPFTLLGGGAFHIWLCLLHCHRAGIAYPAYPDWTSMSETVIQQWLQIKNSKIFNSRAIKKHLILNEYRNRQTLV